MFSFGLSPTLFLALLILSAPATAEKVAQNDPMRPPGLRESGPTRGGVVAPALSHYRLDSIIIAPDRRLAIINGRRLAPGERVGNARLIDIRATEVTLRIAGKPHVLTLLPLSIKKPSSEAKRQ